MTSTIDDVRQQLEDLAAWRSGLSDAVDTILGISSPRLSTDGRGSSNGLALPFHLDQAVDEPDLGGAGVRTEAGLLDLVGSWARSIAHDRGETVKGSPLTYLHTTLQWAQEHADWDGLAGDVKDAWVAVGRIVGFSGRIIGKCPKCGGRIVADSTKDGIDLAAFCEKCDSYYGVDNDGERTSADIKPAAIARLREVRADNERMVTYRQAMEIWEGVLDKDLFFSWVHAERLEYADTDPRTYPLSQINYLADLTATRRSARPKAS